MRDSRFIDFDEVETVTEAAKRLNASPLNERAGVSFGMGVNSVIYPLVNSTSGQTDQWSDRPVVLSEGNGFVQLPHKVNQWVQSRKLGGAAKSVLTYLVTECFRYRPHRGVVTASYRGMARWTGVSSDGNIRRTVNMLIDRKLIERVGGFSRERNAAASYKIIFVAEFLSNTSSQNDHWSGNTSSQNDQTPLVGLTRGPLVNSTRLLINNKINKEFEFLKLSFDKREEFIFPFRKIGFSVERAYEAGRDKFIAAQVCDASLE